MITAWRLACLSHRGGELEAPGSITILQLTLEEEAYDEDAVVKMIELIR